MFYFCYFYRISDTETIAWTCEATMQIQSQSYRFNIYFIYFVSYSIAVTLTPFSTEYGLQNTPANDCSVHCWLVMIMRHSYANFCSILILEYRSHRVWRKVETIIITIFEISKAKYDYSEDARCFTKDLDPRANYNWNNLKIAKTVSAPVPLILRTTTIFLAISVCEGKKSLFGVTPLEFHKTFVMRPTAT